MTPVTADSTDAPKPDNAETTTDTVDESSDTASNGAADESADPSLEEQMEAVKAERDEINKRLLRTAAELENYKRRNEREKQRRYEAGKVEVVRAMLDVLDDFERSMDAAATLDEADDPAEAYESLKSGVEMVFQKFRDQLKTLDVEPIEAEGKPFDESLHEAMMQQPTDDAEPGTVVHEVRTGYTMGDRVIRYSRVVVASEPDEN
jgi:molecular chaperone GrpE